MEMEFINILRVIWHWRSLIISILVVSVAALIIRTRVVDPVYEASVVLQINNLPVVGVDFSEGTSSTDSLDQITSVRNGLTQVLLSEETSDKTLDELDLDDKQFSYEVDVNHGINSDFISVSISANEPYMAAEIANTHVMFAIEYYGELFIKPLLTVNELLASQLMIAEEEYQSAQKAFNDHRSQNGIYYLVEEILISKNFLEQLKFDRDRAIIDKAVAVVPIIEDEIAENQVSGTTIVAEMNKLITERELALERLIELEPSHLLLQNQLDQTYEKFRALKDKYDNSNLTVLTLQTANFIQIIDSAEPIQKTSMNITKALIIPLIGAFGFSILLAFVLEYVLMRGERQPASIPSTISEL